MKDLTQLTQFELITEAITLIGNLTALDKVTMQYAREAELLWRKNDLPKLGDILDELQWHLNPEKPDAQRLWNEAWRAAQ